MSNLKDYITPNFQRWEVACPCCGIIHMDIKVMSLAQAVRNKLNEPLYVCSGGGYRCQSYHKQECGNYPSPHTEGLAIDLYRKPCGNHKNMIELAKIMKEVGFTRIGLYPIYWVKSVHGDLVKPCPSQAWVKTDYGYIYMDTLEEAINFIEDGFYF